MSNCPMACWKCTWVKVIHSEMQMKAILVILLVFLNLSGKAQFNHAVTDGEGRTIQGLGDLAINVIKPEDTEGTPLLFEEWKKGRVLLRMNKVINGVSLQLNLERNVPYFQRDSIRYEFSDRVLEFSLLHEVAGKADTFLFRSNYPLNGKYTDRSFYRVLAEGTQVQLLCYMYKTIQENFGFDKNYKRAYQLREELFIFLPATRQFFPVNGKKSLQIALPGYAARIEQLCRLNKWNLKTTSQLQQLVWQLNSDQ